jgi:hypothetical protein
VGAPQTVNGQLIFLTAAVLQPTAHLIGQVEGIAQNGEGNFLLLHQLQQLPEVGMEDGVSAGEIKIGKTAIYLAKVQTVVEGILHLLPAHGIQGFAVVFGKNVAVLAPLITFIGDVPLKGKILHGFLLRHVGVFYSPKATD